MDSQGQVAGTVAERLDQLRGPDEGGAPLVRLLIDNYLDQTPDELDDLADALSRRDYPTVATKAHRLKGSAANIGAAGLADCLAGIEEVGRTAHEPDADPVPQLRAEFETVRAVLRARTGGGG